MIRNTKDDVDNIELLEDGQWKVAEQEVISLDKVGFNKCIIPIILIINYISIFHIVCAYLFCL